MGCPRYTARSGAPEAEPVIATATEAMTVAALEVLERR